MGAVDLDAAVRDRNERAKFEMALGQAPPPERSRPWVFPSDISKAGHIEGMQHLNARIGAAGGTRFWFLALRNCLITVADLELMLPRARPSACQPRPAPGRDRRLRRRLDDGAASRAPSASPIESTR